MRPSPPHVDAHVEVLRACIEASHQRLRLGLHQLRAVGSTPPKRSIDSVESQNVKHDHRHLVARALRQDQGAPVPVQAAKRGKECLARIRGIGVGASRGRESRPREDHLTASAGRSAAAQRFQNPRIPASPAGRRDTRGRPRRGPGPRGPPAPRKTSSDLQPSRPPSENVADQLARWPPLRTDRCIGSRAGYRRPGRASRGATPTARSE